MKAVILAGGRGRRLEPYTTVLPKPLMPVRSEPVVEIIIQKLAFSGFDEIYLAVGHLASLIQAYLGDGTRYGVKLFYSIEDEPLGTIAPLKLLEHELRDEAFIVLNGDVLTDMDIRRFWEFHTAHGAPLSIAVTERHVDIDFGVAELNGDLIKAYHEKPKITHWVSMGIYGMTPSIFDFIPLKSYFDLPQLVNKLISEGVDVKAYRHFGFWLDIGREEDFKSAQNLPDEIMAKLKT